MQPYDVTEATVPYQRKAMRSFDYGDAIAARHPTANWDTLIGIAYGIKEEYCMRDYQFIETNKRI